MYQRRFITDVIKATIILMALFALCRWTMGGVAIAVVLAGAFFALKRQGGLLAGCYAFIATLTIFNREIVGFSGVTLMTARLGNLFLIAVMLFTGAGFSGRMREKLPISMLFIYCLAASISSMTGWMPLISFLKLGQFVFFLAGLLFITRILQQSDKGLYQLRCIFMAFAIIFLVGSVVSYLIPSLGYSMVIQNAAAWGTDITGEELLQSGQMLLFSGMTSHSQIIAPVTAMMSAWVLCDMILIERRMSLLHVGILSVAPILLYISRSRGGLLELVAVMGVAMLVCVPRARLAAAVKNKFAQVMILAAVALIIIGTVAQIRSQAISKWLRKTDDVAADSRSLSHAFTESRQGLVKMNIDDFKRNPLFGMGFQVARGFKEAYRTHIITWYSAAVEKGVTPLVVLGETGLTGAMVFLGFLCVFYSTCLRRRYLTTLTMFTCFLVANLADSTMFSPGGMGSFLWITSCVGGFGIDMISIRQAHGIWRGPGDDRFGNHLPPPGMFDAPPPPPKPKRLASGRIVYE